eukprot:1467265-Prymnesium_polylepis.1
MSDGLEGIVGGTGNVKAYAAEEFFRLFYRPQLLPLPRPAAARAAAAGADVAELVGGSVRTEEQSIDAG